MSKPEMAFDRATPLLVPIRFTGTAQVQVKGFLGPQHRQDGLRAARRPSGCGQPLLRDTGQLCEARCLPEVGP